MSDTNIEKKSSVVSDNNENICIVCCKNVEIYSIGECDHPVCYECSTRMRVLSKQLECPICRQSLGKVIFTYDKLLYRELEAKNRVRHYNQKYKICFHTRSIQNAFYNLLDHPCPKCNRPPFRKFTELRDHVLRDHDLHYCDLCTDNLKIFSFERRCYTKAELSLHRRKGDPDNRSHRGHPLCEYCDTRYLDRDELFRHLRREHYFCHFCEADGCNEFYNDYNSLRDHFRKDHYLCEEGKCATEEFTGAFRTDIDYKAHVANVHGKSLNKQQVKQARTLQLEITLGPRGRSGQTEPHIANLRSRGNEENHEVQAETIHVVPSQRAPPIDARNEQEFPSLGGGAPSTLTLLPPSMTMHARLGASGLARTKENFPALGGSDSGGGGPSKSANRPSQTSISSVIKKKGSGPTPTSIHISNRPSTSANSTKKSNPPSKSDFPALPGKSKNAANAAFREDMIPSNSNINMNSVSAKHRALVDDYVSVANPSNFNKLQLMQREAEEIKTKKAIKDASAPKLDSQDFPALAMGPKLSTPVTSNWAKTQRQRDAENRKSKVAPAPLLPTNTKQKSSKNSQNGGSGNNNNPATENNNKKEKKSKKAVDDGKKSPDAISSSKQKKENNNENKPMNSNVTALVNNGNTGSMPEDINAPNFVHHRTIGPPPGFVAPVRPPPGFQNVTLKSVVKSPNNLTFTSSLGESYNIVPTHSYIQPPESFTRNQKLVTRFKKVMETADALERFRQVSLRYREGVFDAEEYYEHCQAVMQDQFHVIFPELLSLLPDITKQQALYLVHSQHLKSLSSEQLKQFPKVEVCSTCKQVLMSFDANDHKKLHAMHNSFPGLANVEVKGSSLTNACRK